MSCERPAIPDANPAPQSEQEIITVSEVAQILRCQPSSVYNLTRKRAKRYKHTPLPVIRLPLGLRFKRSSVLRWLDSLESTGAGRMTNSATVEKDMIITAS